MKLALFFFLSLTVHATAFLVPIAINGRAATPAIVVAVLPLESATEPSGSAGAPAGEMRASAMKTGKVTSKDRNAAAAPSSLPITPEKPSVDVPSVAADQNLMSTTGIAVASVAILNGSGENPAAGAGAGGKNFAAGNSGTGSGHGFGNGEGSGTGPAEATLTQARYRETPKPAYPDIARREGREGQVLLRVLIDDQGKTKTVEINRSSGSDALDRAATEAIKLWRFAPARLGNKAVESWVKIPIEFRLND